MKIFVDTADTEQIQALNAYGIVDGVTTNPSLIAQSGRDIREVLAEICKLVDGPISGETVSTDAESMVREGRWLRQIADNMVVKVPLTPEGIQACHQLSKEGHPVNVTLCFSANQALLAAKAGATFISPFVGRLDDISQDGLDLIADIVEIYNNYGFETEVLAASVRGPQHALHCAKLGADVITAPPKVIHQLFHHPLTDKGLAAFLKDWEKTGQTLGQAD